MSGPAEDTAGSGNRRGAWAGLVIGIVVMSGALLAVLHDRDSSDDSAPRPQAKTEWTHHYPAKYVGPVWITVDAPDDAPRTLVIRWGGYQKRIHHDVDEPTIYVFNKDSVDAGGKSVPTTIHVEPGAVVTFDQGPNPPVGSQDVNGGWQEAGA
ncbi:MAG TPA: hypothetical protein VGO78_19435 [Acidimicrobiales bacterium]|jgi:hypothetical protein|nr:hypothetical protein [Acidimicrobiales bacterium]